MSTKAATRRPKAAPPMTSKTVPQGKSSRMAKGRAAQEKAAANKAAVDRLNVRARAADACDEKVFQPLTVGERQDLYNKAKVEATAIKAARISGKPTPKSPHLDELRARQEMEKKTGAPRSVSAKAGKRTPRVTSERAKLANEERAKRGGRRGGRGRQVSEQELLDYIIGVQKAHPESPLGIERRYAIWIEGMAFSRSRWAGLWEAAARGEKKADDKPTRKPKAEKKPAVAKAAAKPKAPVKKATPGQKAKAGANAPTPRRANGTIAPKPKADPAKSNNGTATPTMVTKPLGRKDVTPIPKAKDTVKAKKAS